LPFDESAVWTDFAVGDRRFGAKSTDMTMVFVLQGERFRFATNVSRDLKAVTLVVDVMSMMSDAGYDIAAIASAHDPGWADRARRAPAS
jgi:hypothetical protein